jgi:hypothetical protein
MSMSPPLSQSSSKASVKAVTETAESAMSPDASGDESAPQSAKSWRAQEHASREGSSESAEDSKIPGSSEDAPSVPVQKRRRVTRACDECRRKKIKCDGKQPCTHCSVYSYGKLILRSKASGAHGSSV